MMPTYAMIMAGGSGTRLWPLSRQTYPKFLLKPESRKSLLEQTIRRLRGVVSPGCFRIVCGRAHVGPIRREVKGLLSRHFIVEPVARNTSPCIGLAALKISEEDPDAVLVVLPADHYIKDQKKFQGILKSAAVHARREGTIVTIGIIPTAPHTGYGYIQRGRRYNHDAVYRVKRFVEKPDLKTARRYVASGRYYWNGGIFVGLAAVFLSEIRKHMPELFAGLEKIREREGIDKVYPSLPNISIDYGVMEKTKRLDLIPGDFDWCDVGDLVEFSKLSRKSRGLVEIDGKNSLTLGDGRLVATLGLDNLLIAQSPDALLITTRDRAQDVRKVTAVLRERGLAKFL